MEAGVRAAARRRNWEGFGHGDDACGISSKEPGLQQACGGGRGAEGRRERLGGARRGGGDIALCAPPPLALLVGSLAVCDALVLPGFRLGGVGGHGAAWASAGRMFSPQQHCCLPRSIPTCSRRRGLSPRMCTDPIEIGGSWSSEGHDKHAMLPKWWTGEAVAAFLKKSPQATSPPAPPPVSRRDGCTSRIGLYAYGVREGAVGVVGRTRQPALLQTGREVLGGGAGGARVFYRI